MINIDRSRRRRREVAGPTQFTGVGVFREKQVAARVVGGKLVVPLLGSKSVGPDLNFPAA
jgi:hypothetical protein